MAAQRIATPPSHAWRYRLSLFAIGLVFAVLLLRTLWLQTDASKGLSDYGSQYQQRVHRLGAKRGAIYDRNGQPLAVSSKVYSIGIDPRRFDGKQAGKTAELARILGLKPGEIRAKLGQSRKKSFFYLRRQIPPAEKRAVEDLGLAGVVSKEEHKRFYPDRESFANILGITDIDDRGLEGLELAFDKHLAGREGRQRFIRDNRGRIIEDLGIIEAPRPGKDLYLSLDRRLQHLAFTELAKTVAEHRARAGSMVIVDVRNGEILAMVNVPSFNPNNRANLSPRRMRNRGAVDVFEPGSTIKPLTIAAALDSGEYQTGTRVDIGAGKLELGEFVIKDVSTEGVLSVAEILKFSSNVGASLIAMDLGAERIWRNLDRFGLGKLTHSSFPGESTGLLQSHIGWPKAVVATHSYGYGVSMTLLQLARSYAILGNGGRAPALTFVLNEASASSPRVISADVAKQVLAILGDIVQDGTGRRAQINGYSVGGKTGTSRKFDSSGGYSEDRYNSMFVGISPMLRPRIVCAVIIDEPEGEYYGGQVAAPLFARVVSAAMRLLGVPADRVSAHGV